MSLPPLNALRAFEAVVRLGSFRAAAAALFVTQSAVSHQIRHLEQWFGGDLFDRTGNRPVPLPHAQELARALSLSFAEMTAACTRAREHRETHPLVIAAIPSVAICWLIPRLADFRERHGGEVRIVYALHGQGIDFRDVHLAFVFGAAPPAIAGVRVDDFLPGVSVPVCSPEHATRLATQAGTGPAPLAWALLHDTDLTGWQAWFRRAGIDAPVPQGGPVFADFNLLRAAALAGQGVALCPAAMVRPDLEAGRLVQLSSVSVLEDQRYFLLSAPVADPALAAQARAFRDWTLAQRGGI
ncbi:MAG: hypothetical protein RIR62_911 [Pseudomonadota bacterium]|jgi:DNA-binding transcriptional LysR family regulator